MAWICESGGNRPTHVYPTDDLREHNTETDICWCDPEIEYVEGGTIIIHAALDEREKFERGERKPS